MTLPDRLNPFASTVRRNYDDARCIACGNHYAHVGRQRRS